MMKMHILLFIFLYYIISNCTNSAAIVNNNNRRTLHQPFFPQDSPGVPPPPSSSAAADVPFTPSSSPPNDDQPFFQTIPSPPPPLATTNPSASFPANISSLNLPSSSKSKPVSAKLIATAVTLVVAAAVVVSVVVYLRVQKRRLHDSRSVGDEKTYRSDSSSSRRVTIACNVNHNNNNNGGGAAGGGGAGAGARNDNNNLNRIPKLNRPSQSSAEFLYLGTLVSSQGGIDVTNNNTNAISRENNRVRGVGGGGGGVGDLNLNFRKLDSPELRPLPPLVSVGGGGRSQSSLRNPNLENVEVDSSRDEEFEEFYSPRGSIGTGSGSRSAFSAAVPAAAADGYESRRMIGSGSSSSCSSSSSGSPVRSVSLSISPPVSLSPIRSRPKSPELVALQNVPPPSRAAPPPPPPPPPPLNIRLNKDSLESSPRSSDSNSSSSGQGSPPPPAGIPPPPPPPPPAPKHWESSSPKTPTPPLQPLLKPPVLITPTRPLPLPLTNNDQPPISPMELLPENPENHETPKPKLKPLHWDKVRASSDREMVWDQLKSSSFKLNEEMIETLFTVKTPNSANSNETSATRRPILSSPTGHENRVLDPKKSQNIAILLRALNVTIEEVCDALLEGNADTLGTELLESLLKMAPTKEEERKLIEFKDDSPIKLGPAEKFLKAVLDVPFAFKRVDAMLYISNFDSEIEYLKRSFQTLEVACEELRNSRMFLKLLEAVLKTGNRMNVGTNRGDAHAFKLDTLLKLVDVKGTDGKTTLLHFVVQEITKSEGARLSTATTEPNHPETPKGPADETKCRKLGLQVVAGISSELSNVKKSAAMDSEVLDSDVVKLSKGIANITEVVRLIETTRSDGGDQTRFSRSMNEFIKTAEEEIIRIQAQESVALSLVKEITEYFHGNSAKEEAHPFRIFLVVRDFLTVLDRVCKEVGSINERIVISSAHKFPVPINPTLPPVFSGFPGRQAYSSSDDESSGSSFRVSS